MPWNRALANASRRFDVRQPGLLFGEFDPVNNCIIQIASHVANSDCIPDVTLVPCNLPGIRPAAGMDNRIEMARLAVHGVMRLQVSPEGISDLPAFLSTGQLSGWTGGCEASTFIFRADELVMLSGYHVALDENRDILIIPCPGIDISTLAESVFGDKARISILDVIYKREADEAVKSMPVHFDDPVGLLHPDVIGYIALNGLYLPDYALWVKSMISSKRFRHTLGVRDTAVCLARRHGAPMIRSAVSGLLHDCAKDMPLAGMLAAIQNCAEVDPDMLESGALLHGPAGACVAHTVFGISDSAILSAIACHTVGRIGMTPLDLCLFVADAIEPCRSNYSGLKEIRALAQTDLRRAALLSMQCTREYVLEKGEPYSKSTLLAMKDIEDRIKEDNQ